QQVCLQERTSPFLVSAFAFPYCHSSSCDGSPGLCLVKETPTQQSPETESWNPRTETEMSASHGLPGHIPAREVLSLCTSRRVPISSWFPRCQNADTRAAQSGGWWGRCSVDRSTLSHFGLC